VIVAAGLDPIPANHQPFLFKIKMQRIGAKAETKKVGRHRTVKRAKERECIPTITRKEARRSSSTPSK
jgi:hypothetical protein